MWPWILMTSRTYAPYITLPFAVIVGVIGYNIEGLLRGPSAPHRPSVTEQRNERLLNEILESETTALPSLSLKTFVPKNIFEQNVSPSLQKSK